MNTRSFPPSEQPTSSCSHKTLYEDGMCAVCGIYPLNHHKPMPDDLSRIATALERIANYMQGAKK